jgi:hypothetical protein
MNAAGDAAHFVASPLPNAFLGPLVKLSIARRSSRAPDDRSARRVPCRARCTRFT